MYHENQKTLRFTIFAVFGFLEICAFCNARNFAHLEHSAADGCVSAPSRARPSCAQLRCCRAAIGDPIFPQGHSSGGGWGGGGCRATPSEEPRDHRHHQQTINRSIDLCAVEKVRAAQQVLERKMRERSCGATSCSAT